MKYDDDKPTTCDHFDGVQKGDKIAVNLTDGSRFVGKVERASKSIVKLEMTTMYGGVLFTRTDEGVKSVEVLERGIVPGLYVTPTLPRSILRYNGRRWVQIVVDSGHLNRNFDPELFNDLEKIELPEYMYL